MSDTTYLVLLTGSWCHGFCSYKGVSLNISFTNLCSRSWVCSLMTWGLDWSLILIMWHWHGCIILMVTLLLCLMCIVFIYQTHMLCWGCLLLLIRGAGAPNITLIFTILHLNRLICILLTVLNITIFFYKLLLVFASFTFWNTITCVSVCWAFDVVFGVGFSQLIIQTCLYRLLVLQCVRVNAACILWVMIARVCHFTTFAACFDVLRKIVDINRIVINHII